MRRRAGGWVFQLPGSQPSGSVGCIRSPMSFGSKACLASPFSPTVPVKSRRKKAGARRRSGGMLAGASSGTCRFAGGCLEAAGGVEPPIEILQTSALTTWLRRLGAGAPHDERQTTEHIALVSASPPRGSGAGEGTRTLDLLQGKHGSSSPEGDRDRKEGVEGDE